MSDRIPAGLTKAKRERASETSGIKPEQGISAPAVADVSPDQNTPAPLGPELQAMYRRELVLRAGSAAAKKKSYEEQLAALGSFYEQASAAGVERSVLDAELALRGIELPKTQIAA